METNCERVVFRTRKKGGHNARPHRMICFYICTSLMCVAMYHMFPNASRTPALRSP
jgi:hypothetical protein